MTVVLQSFQIVRALTRVGERDSVSVLFPCRTRQIVVLVNWCRRNHRYGSVSIPTNAVRRSPALIVRDGPATACLVEFADEEAVCGNNDGTRDIR